MLPYSNIGLGRVENGGYSRHKLFMDIVRRFMKQIGLRRARLAAHAVMITGRENI